MNRRAFLKVIGLGATVAALPGTATHVLLEVSAPTPANAVQLGLVREIWAYDIYVDRQLVRFDVLAENNTQLTVALEANADAAELRREAMAALDRKMNELGIAWTDLRPLPAPPEWLQRQSA